MFSDSSFSSKPYSSTALSIFFLPFNDKDNWKLKERENNWNIKNNKTSFSIPERNTLWNLRNV